VIKIARGIQQLWCGGKNKNREFSSSITLYNDLLLKSKVLLPLSFISYYFISNLSGEWEDFSINIGITNFLLGPEGI